MFFSRTSTCGTSSCSASHSLAEVLLPGLAYEECCLCKFITYKKRRGVERFVHCEHAPLTDVSPACRLALSCKGPQLYEKARWSSYAEGGTIDQARGEKPEPKDERKVEGGVRCRFLKKPKAIVENLKIVLGRCETACLRYDRLKVFSRSFCMIDRIRWYE